MIHLSWNLVRNQAPVADCRLISEIQSFLGLSLDKCNAALHYASAMGKTIIWHGRAECEAAHYCEHCLVEVLVLCSYGTILQLDAWEFQVNPSGVSASTEHR
jgi:hypothetical protein